MVCDKMAFLGRLLGEGSLLGRRSVSISAQIRIRPNLLPEPACFLVKASGFEEVSKAFANNKQ
jgi:hypothetical protein